MPDKNPHAQALGKLGGRKGGLQKWLAALPPEQRTALARAAAEKRWRTCPRCGALCPTARQARGHKCEETR